MEKSYEISNLTKEFSKQNLSENFKPKKLLYIDGISFLFTSYGSDPFPPNHWDITTPMQKVKIFVEAAHKTGYLLKVFIKGDSILENEKDNWMTEEEYCVETKPKSFPYKTNYLIWTFFNKCGVETLFSYENNVYETISAYSQKDNASILSRNNIFFRYFDRNFEIYEEYQINSEGFLVLIAQKKPEKKPAVIKKVLDYLPNILNKNTAIHHLIFENRKDLFMGCSSPLLKIYDNPYFIIRPLRQAVYYRLGIKEKIEYIIRWDNVKKLSVWNVNLVRPDEKYNKFLKKPVEAVEEFFKVSSLKKPNYVDEIIWNNHLFSLYAVVFETCSIFSEECEKFFFELFEKTKINKINHEIIERPHEKKQDLKEKYKLLYLDGFNFLLKFFKFGDNVNHWNVNYTFKKVKQFVSTMKKSNFLLKVFIKFENVSKEELRKWMAEREKEVTGKKKKQTPKSAYFLWNFFNECDIEVFFTYEADFYDTIVSHAQEHNAFILSSSQKLLKYKNQNYEVYKDFKINNKGLTLTPISKNIKKNSSLKEILQPPAKVLSKNAFSFLIKNKSELMLGCPSSLVKRFGNPYSTIRPLRQAVYYRLGIKEMTEYIPFWDPDSQKAIWDVTCVKSDPKLNDLLDKPLEAVEILFNFSKLIKPQDTKIVEWKNYLFCLNVVVLELCAAVTEEAERKFFEFFQKVKEPIVNENVIPRYWCCKDCSKEFENNEARQKHYEEKGLSLPMRCSNECLEFQNKSKTANKN